MKRRASGVWVGWSTTAASTFTEVRHNAHPNVFSFGFIDRRRELEGTWNSLWTVGRISFFE
jgi:hypothetical protein